MGMPNELRTAIVTQRSYRETIHERKQDVRRKGKG